MSFADKLRERAAVERSAALASLAAADDLASAAAAIDSIAVVLESHRHRIDALTSAAEQLRAEIARLKADRAGADGERTDKPIDNWQKPAPSMAASDD